MQSPLRLQLRFGRHRRVLVPGLFRSSHKLPGWLCRARFCFTLILPCQEPWHSAWSSPSPTRVCCGGDYCARSSNWLAPVLVCTRTLTWIFQGRFACIDLLYVHSSLSRSTEECLELRMGCWCCVSAAGLHRSAHGSALDTNVNPTLPWQALRLFCDCAESKNLWRPPPRWRMGPCKPSGKQRQGCVMPSGTWHAAKRLHRQMRCCEADRCAVGQPPLLARRGVRKVKRMRAEHDAEDHQQHRCAAQQHLRVAPAWCEGRVVGQGKRRSTAWRRQLRRHSSCAR